MKKIILCVLIFLMAFVMTGCYKRYDQILHDHKADKMFEDGVWESRYDVIQENPATGDMVVPCSINVNQDMSESDMMEIMDYFRIQFHSDMDEEGIWLGISEGDFIVYAVFYKGDTDEVIRKIKYVNGESVKITEEDEVKFPSPDMRSKAPSDETE